MITFSLQSGSSGNAIYVEAEGVRLLFDAGINGDCARRRMQRHGRDIREVDAVVISHDHTDHIRCAGVYQRKFGLPIYMTRKTLAVTWCPLGILHDVRFFKNGDVLEFPTLRVHTIPTAHDAADGAAFVVESSRAKLAILTDLGHPFPALAHILSSVDAAYLESNYDPAMLASGSYPPPVKARIMGPGGHLSNLEAAELVRACGRRRPRWVAAAHLSQNNNLPGLAIEAHQQAVGQDYPIFHASRFDVSPLWTV